MEEHRLLQQKVRPQTSSDIEKSDGPSAWVPPYLPVELHEFFINALDGDRQALKQCALTCRLYRHLAQRLLLRSITLSFFTRDLNYSPTDAFLNILDVSPHLARHLGRKWIQEDKNLLLQVIPALVNLTDLVIGWKRFTFHFSDFSYPVMLRINTRCESLVNLTLVNVRGVHGSISTT
ncbi:hypothetical protein CPC08DRAFT_820385 [Agrocybe pediades]|nr:hypothetical protein CPC08DRAFT_820385 [Agrocybe pediades]